MKKQKQYDLDPRLVPLIMGMPKAVLMVVAHAAACLAVEMKTDAELRDATPADPNLLLSLILQ